MTARKKAPRKRKVTRKPSGKKAAGAKKARRRRQPASVSTNRKPKRAGTSARARAASLADRLTELVEHAAAGALRRVVDSGGREIAAWLPEAAELRHEAGSLGLL